VNQAQRPPDVEAPAYRDTDSGMVWSKPTREGHVDQPLTNFTAHIVAEGRRDDGAEVESVFEIEAVVQDRHETFFVPAAKFATMSWAIEHLGAGAVIYPGYTIRDHARAAIQSISTRLGIKCRNVYTHTGWRSINGKQAYLHAGGGIGADGTVANVDVELPRSLTPTLLPDPPSGPALRQTVRDAMDVLKLGPARVVMPCWCALWRVVLGQTDFSIHLHGPSGSFKTELAALLQQHFGAGYTSRRLPASWSSTENALESLAFVAKDALLVIDELTPAGSQSDVQALYRKVERVLRAQGNQSGRQRLRQDSSLRPERPPRGLILSTGEDLPPGQSLRARILILEVGRNDISKVELTKCQRLAASGTFAAAMSAYIHWLARRGDPDVVGTRRRTVELRDQVQSQGQHRRTPEIVANLLLGLEYFLAFARECGALEEDDASTIWNSASSALSDAMDAQLQQQRETDPCQRFFELLGAAITSGNAHVVSSDGKAPDRPQVWGWREQNIGGGAYARTEWHAKGVCVGWLSKDDEVFLQPDNAYAVAKAANIGADGLNISGSSLGRQLADRGFIIRDPKRKENRVRKTLAGAQRKVYHLKNQSLLFHKPDEQLA
jgi:hypothetical protein